MSAARRIARAVFAGICLVVPAWAFPLRAPNHRKHTESEKVTISLDSSSALKTVSSAERLTPAVPLYGPADTVTMFIIGDVMLHSRQMEYSYDSFLEHISGRMKAADISVANMEFPLGGKPYTGYPAFSAPDEYARYVNRCGANVFLAANNHILDKGYTGIDRTLHVYDSLEAAGAIRYTGISADSQDNAGRYPLIVNVRGVRIALLNFTYGTNNPAKPGVWPKVNLADTTDIAEALSRAKERKPDFIIALPHWGIEYELRHSARQERLARWLVSKGGQCNSGCPSACHPGFLLDKWCPCILFARQCGFKHERRQHSARARGRTEVCPFATRRRLHATPFRHVPMVFSARQIHRQLCDIGSPQVPRQAQSLEISI